MKKVVVFVVFVVFSNSLKGQVEKDKQLHFLGGTLYGLVGAGIAKQISHDNPYWTFAGSVGGSLLIGLAKESIDKKQYGGWDNKDLMATVLGGISVGTTIEIFTNRKKRKKRKTIDYTFESEQILLLETRAMLVSDYNNR